MLFYIKNFFSDILKKPFVVIKNNNFFIFSSFRPLPVYEKPNYALLRDKMIFNEEVKHAHEIVVDDNFVESKIL